MKHDSSIPLTKHHAGKLHAARHAIASVFELHLEVVSNEGLSFPTTRMVPRIGETRETFEQDLELEQSFFFLLIGELGVPSRSRFVQFTLETT